MRAIDRFLPVESGLGEVTQTFIPRFLAEIHKEDSLIDNLVPLGYKTAGGHRPFATRRIAKRVQIYNVVQIGSRFPLLCHHLVRRDELENDGAPSAIGQ